MKTIVTHISPDVDAITSVWLLKRFLPGWDEASVAFIPAGTTLNNDSVDSDPEIFHVDTGMGLLDHHQTDEDTCAARRCMEYISSKIRNSKFDIRKFKSNNFPDEALGRLIDVVNDIDHFRESSYPNPAADFYDFSLVAILDGLKLIYSEDHQKLTDFGLMAMDGIYKQFQNKVWAEHEIQKSGVEFMTVWGRGIGVETVNDETVRLAQKQGYTLAVRKDPKKGFIRIKASPGSETDLTACYNILREKDKTATWYLHSGKKMLLNGSMKNPNSRPTKLTLKEIIEVLEKK
jgi:hypothetical protein